jgi:cell division protein FtsW (lipid II flippase)
MKKTKEIFLVALPILIMVGLVDIIENDYALTLLYIVIILGIFSIKKEKKTDMIVFWFGFVMMIIFEYIFISTGVETFLRNSLFSVMPLWLPFLWGYGFVAIKDGVKILERR